MARVVRVTGFQRCHLEGTEHSERLASPFAGAAATPAGRGCWATGSIGAVETALGISAGGPLFAAPVSLTWTLGGRRGESRPS